MLRFLSIYTTNVPIVFSVRSLSVKPFRSSAENVSNKFRRKREVVEWMFNTTIVQSEDIDWPTIAASDEITPKSHCSGNFGYQIIKNI